MPGHPAIQIENALQQQQAAGRFLVISAAIFYRLL
jgi:hypothetical protein